MNWPVAQSGVHESVSPTPVAVAFEAPQLLHVRLATSACPLAQLMRTETGLTEPCAQSSSSITGRRMAAVLETVLVEVTVAVTVRADPQPATATATTRTAVHAPTTSWTWWIRTGRPRLSSIQHQSVALCWQQCRAGCRARDRATVQSVAA
jgi:hypothetical protein